MKNIRRLFLLFLMSLTLACRSTDLITSRPEPVRPVRPTFTKVAQAAPTETPTPAPTRTRTPTRRPTPRPTNTIPAPTAVPVTLAPAINPNWEYVWDRSQKIDSAPNCGGPYFKIKVKDQAGGRVNGVVVQISFFENHFVKVSGLGEADGEVGFTPFGPEQFHLAKKVTFEIVRSEKDRTVISEVIEVNFQDCAITGQYENITFKKR